jgi:hypothetical protein
VTIVATIALVATGSAVLGILLGVALASLLGAYAFRCHHPAPLGLLPPTTDADGTRLPARWFCERCGGTWPAGFEHEHRPIPRYEGFDQSKAPEAARRADDLYKKKHAMALKRAGYSGGDKRKTPERPAAEVVAIEPLRRAK